MEIINRYQENIKKIINLEEVNKYIDYLKKELEISKKFTLVFVDNEEIAMLNQEFRNKDYATDVLTFHDETEVYLGDIIISIDKAFEQAEEYKHSFKRELYFLLTHGVLHLLGYDHQNKIEEKIMFEKQEYLLENYGVVRK